MKRFVVLVFVLALAGCTSGPADAPAVPAPSALPVAGADCPGLAARAKPVRFGVNGATNLVGLIGGTGTTGVVLSHMSEGSVCQWSGTFSSLVGQGYRVLAYDFHGTGASESASNGYDADVAAAAAALRADGATAIVLMGASLGGAASVVASTVVQPPVSAVVSVSAPLIFASVSAQEAAPAVTVPVLYVAQADDGLFGDAARQLAEASTASEDARYLVTPGSTHGSPIVEPGGDAQLRAAVADFLADHAPPA